MGDKKQYPPTYLRPGDSTRLTAHDGEMDFIGVNTQEVLDFIAAYAEYRLLDELPIQPSNATKEHAKRKLEKAFNSLPKSVFMEIEQRNADAVT